MLWYSASLYPRLGLSYAFSALATLASWILVLYISGRTASKLMRVKYSELRGFVVLAGLLTLPIALAILILMGIAYTGF